MANLIQVKTVLNKTKIRDSWFLDDYTLNPYSGCSFNCLYCYIRGSKYGAHMEEKLGIKINLPELLDKQLYLRAKKGQHGFIVLSSATDPYLQFEEEYKLTRQALEIILRHKFPVHIITKSDLVERDFDLLEQIDKSAILPPDLKPLINRGTLITFSFSTIDDTIGKQFEPGATSPSLRLKTLETAVRSGFKSGVSMMPMLPYITDKVELLEQMFSALKNANAGYVMPATLTLFGNGPSDSRTLVFRAIEKYYPELKEKYKRLYAQSMRLPDFYLKAFHAKMNELGKKYSLPSRIITL